MMTVIISLKNNTVFPNSSSTTALGGDQTVLSHTLIPADPPLPGSPLRRAPWGTLLLLCSCPVRLEGGPPHAVLCSPPRHSRNLAARRRQSHGPDFIVARADLGSYLGSTKYEFWLMSLGRPLSPVHSGLSKAAGFLLNE